MRISQISSPKSWLAQNLKSSKACKTVHVQTQEITTSSSPSKSEKTRKTKPTKLIKSLFKVNRQNIPNDIEYLMII